MLTHMRFAQYQPGFTGTAVSRPAAKWIGNIFLNRDLEDGLISLNFDHFIEGQQRNYVSHKTVSLELFCLAAGFDIGQ